MHTACILRLDSLLKDFLQMWHWYGFVVFVLYSEYSATILCCVSDGTVLCAAGVILLVHVIDGIFSVFEQCLWLSAFSCVVSFDDEYEAALLLLEPNDVEIDGDNDRELILGLSSFGSQ